MHISRPTTHVGIVHSPSSVSRPVISSIYTVATTHASLSCPQTRSQTRRRATSESKSAESISGRTEEASKLRPHDPFIAAAQRVKSLVSTAGDGEEELLDMMMINESPEEKLQVTTGLGALLTVTSVVICTLCDKDPWGGISFSLETLQAIALGGLFALPLVGLRLWSWSPAASKVLPSLEDMHIAMLREAKPFYSGMSWSQVLMMNALQIPPFLLLLLPASQGIIAASTAMSSNLMHPGMMEGLSSASEAATQAHDLLVRTTGLILTSGVVAIGQSLDLSLGIEEIEVLEVASENADRFYRVMSPDATSSNTEADTAANAFRAVVKAYLQNQSETCLTAGAIAFFDCMLLGGLWYGTGNLAAPIVVALSVSMVDSRKLHQDIKALEESAAKKNTKR